MSKLESIVRGGLRQNAMGQWVNGRGEAVDITKLPAKLRREYNIKEEKEVTPPVKEKQADDKTSDKEE